MMPEKTVLEAKRLFAAVDRPNLMIKIPATPAGIAGHHAGGRCGHQCQRNPHLQPEPISAGRRRLVRRARGAASARQIRGPRRLRGLLFCQPARFETWIRGSRLSDFRNGRGKWPWLMPRLPLTSTRPCSARRAGRNWRIGGARRQRLLWASTGAKNPRYSDTIYVDDLIGSGTVNTAPPATLQAWMEHGRTAASLPAPAEATAAALNALAEMGINLEGVTEELQKEGVAAFAKSFAALMQSIGEKQKLFSS